MSAEVLRKAAALMRERAEAATPGDPARGGDYEAQALGSEGYAVMGAPRPGYRLTRTFVARCGMNDWDTDKANATHIASWHPAVALAVALLLDNEASLIESTLHWPDLHMPVNSARVDLLLDLATTYLGSDA